MRMHMARQRIEPLGVGHIGVNLHHPRQTPDTLVGQPQRGLAVRRQGQRVVDQNETQLAVRLGLTRSPGQIPQRLTHPA